MRAGIGDVPVPASRYGWYPTTPVPPVGAAPPVNTQYIGRSAVRAVRQVGAHTQQNGQALCLVTEGGAPRGAG